jgi:2-polyprenyl-3-methyl-5-hydroxy-6-metoxy-1,4-benzoquinol methylase
MDRREHWENVYRTKQPTEMSWYSPHLQDSLRLIREVAPPASRIIDVGGGASTLVDDLLDAGYAKLTVLDISEAALDSARARLKDRATSVTWRCADVTAERLPGVTYDVWHDRAVFHFLTDESDRRAYVRTLRRALSPSGHVVIGTFALNGPERCSGLDVVRYDAIGLQRELGEDFVLTASEEPVHVTPAGKEQRFVLCRFERRSAEGG